MAYPLAEKYINLLTDFGWLFLLKHLPELTEPPQSLQESIFLQLFEVAEIANFSPVEQESYQNSLKYYRDLNNVVDTSRQEGRKEGTKSLVLQLLSHKLTEIPDGVQDQIDQLSVVALEALGVALFEFSSIEDLMDWLEQREES